MGRRVGERLAATPSFGVTALGACVAWLVSVTAGIAALVKRAARNWPAWVGLLISGVLTLCLCGIFALNAFGFAK